MVMTDTHAEGQCQRSLGLKIRMEMDGQTDGRTEGITCRANAVGKNKQNIHISFKGYNGLVERQQI